MMQESSSESNKRTVDISLPECSGEFVYLNWQLEFLECFHYSWLGILGSTIYIPLGKILWIDKIISQWINFYGSKRYWRWWNKIIIGQNRRNELFFRCLLYMNCCQESWFRNTASLVWWCFFSIFEYWAQKGSGTNTRENLTSLYRNWFTDHEG